MLMNIKRMQITNIDLKRPNSIRKKRQYHAKAKHQ